MAPVEEGRHQRLEAAAVTAPVEADEVPTGRAVADAVCGARVPGDPPEPDVRVPNRDRLAPLAAVRREPGQRLVLRVGGWTEHPRRGQHQAAVWSNRQLRVALRRIWEAAA